MKEKVIALLNRYGKLIVSFCFVLSILGLILNYAFPNEVLSTQAVNMKTGDDRYLALPQGTVVTYSYHTQYPMRGIQIGIHKGEQTFSQGMVIYKVFRTDTKEIVANGVIALAALTDTQYVYMPFEDKEKCVGDLTLELSYDGGDQGVAPSIIANSTLTKDTATAVNGQTYQGSLKTSYIYSYDRYPLKLDFKYMVLVFAAVFLTLEPRKRVEKYAKK